MWIDQLLRTIDSYNSQPVLLSAEMDLEHLKATPVEHVKLCGSEFLGIWRDCPREAAQMSAFCNELYSNYLSHMGYPLLVNSSAGTEHCAFGSVELFYSDYYFNVLCTGAVGKAQQRTHKAMERPWDNRSNFETVLEVGAGPGVHLPFVRHRYKHYIQADIRRFEQVNNVDDSRALSHLADAQNLPYANDSFDRLIASCLLLHLRDPEKALVEWRRVTRDCGVITVLVPTEPGLMLRLSRKMLTEPKSRRFGFAGYQLFNARDHRNHFHGLRQQIRHVFRHDRIQENRFPFRVPSWNLNLYFVFQISVQKVDDHGDF